MNVIYLVPLLVIGIAPLAFADVFADTEYGKNYDSEVINVNPDGSKVVKFTTKTYERILDDSNQYRDYIFSDLGSSLEIKTASSIVRLDKTTCGFSVHNGNDVFLFGDSITAYQSVVDMYSWNAVTQVNNAACEAYFDGTGGALVAKRYAAGIGFTEYKYVWNEGLWKTQLEATNLSGLTDRVFGFDQTIDLNRDVIFYGGQQRNLDNFDGQTFARTWLEDNKGQMINFLNGMHFDFDLGFDYLDSVNVQDTGVNSSKLVFHYMRNNEILLPNETLIIDPTYSSSNPTVDGDILSALSDCTTSSSNSTSATTMVVGADAGRCYMASLEFPISGIPTGATIDDVDFSYEVTSASASAVACQFKQNTAQRPSTATVESQWDEIRTSTLYASDSSCTSTGSYTVDLGDTANSDLESQLSSGWFAFGITGDQVLGGSKEVLIASEEHATADKPTLTVIYNDIPDPDAVDDLTSTDIADTTVDLSWTEPDLNTGNLTGYQINYSTPWSDSPEVIITNNTGSSDTTTQISGLVENTQYSFRLGVWTEGYNGSGNVLNVTTLEDFALANFTPGFFDVNATNDEIIQIFFERQDINSTALFLNVTYPNSYELACDFEYEFANINQTYRNLDNVTISATAVESSFQFVDVDNEIINVYCWDEGNLENDGSYLISQTSFPLLEQIASFRAGEYGTDGDFGAIDFITLAVVIISMIGFNRINESVGAVFNIILLGALAYFEIIELPTIIFGAIAVTLVLVVTTTRKV